MKLVNKMVNLEKKKVSLVMYDGDIGVVGE